MKKLCIDVRGFSEEKKKWVQDAFFKLGFFWKNGGDRYSHLYAFKYTTVCDEGFINDYLMFGTSLPTEAQKPYLITYNKLMELANMHEHKEPEYLNDKIYTGKVSDWGLPDGSTLKCIKPSCAFSAESVVYSVSCGESIINGCISATHSTYRLISIPKGYKLNDDGSANNIEEKRYWDDEEPLEVGMWFEFEGYSYRALCVDDLYMQVVIDSLNRTLEIVDIRKCKPIDTRTDKQRAIDEVMYYAGLNLSAYNVLDIAYDKWVGKDEN